MDPDVSNFFDGYAHDFDAIYGNANSVVDSIVNRLFRQSMKLRYRKTLERCMPIAGRSVLDVGCGPGHYSIALAGMGAANVLGIDFADGMLELALSRASKEKQANVCTFEKGNFLEYEFGSKFDYTILMGLMDYISRPKDVVEKALSITKTRALFSFPLEGGILAWQRKLRYKSRCDLYLYSEIEVRSLFADSIYANLDIERIERDLFVTVDMTE